ncbi:DUF885 domain-containing protein [Streptomyces triculaminicus]
MTARRIADDYVHRIASLDPMTSTRLGLFPGDHRQPDLSPSGFDALAEESRRALAALNAAPAGEGPVERTCDRLLRERLAAELALHEAGDHYRQLRNVNSPVHRVRRIFALMPTDTEDDWAAVAGRLRNVSAALAGYRATLTEGIGRGLLSAPRQARAVIGQLASWTGQDNGTRSWFLEFVANGPPRMRRELEAAAAHATVGVEEFRSWLRETYLPAADGTPDAVGRERYLLSARWATGTDIDVTETYHWAWEEFHRTAAEMRTAADRVLPGAGVRNVMDHLNISGHALEGEDGIRDWLQGITEQAMDALEGTHFDLADPVRRFESRIAPPGNSTAPYYTGPSLDFSRPGHAYLPALGRTTFPTWQLVSTWYHEGVPGHHLQLAQWVAVADRLSRYQITLGKVSANVEGWALYAERLMDELGFLTDPARRLGYLDKQMLRIIRVIVDIGMHLELTIPTHSGFHPGERWTPELATAFMAAYHGSPAARRAGEIDRYLGWPGQAIGYKLGERAWLRGREAARRRQGPRFDLKSWHMTALSQGSLGLDDLEAELARQPTSGEASHGGRSSI